MPVSSVPVVRGISSQSTLLTNGIGGTSVSMDNLHYKSLDELLQNNNIFTPSLTSVSNSYSGLAIGK